METLRWSLRSLPADILDLLLTSLDATHEILSLWKCGDSLLNSKLAGISQIRLRAALWLGEFRAPSVLYQLPKLRSLSIASRHNLFEDDDGRQNGLLALARAPLETLEFESADAHALLLLFSPSDPNTPPRMSGSLETLFPRLRSLKVRSTTVPLIESNLLALPSTLTRFSTLSLMYTVGKSTIMSNLPRTLLRLECTLKILWPHTIPEGEDLWVEWAQAPPHLEFIGTIDTPTLPSTLNWLPRTLTACEFGWSAWPLPLIESLPPRLLSFEVRRNVYRTHWISHLRENWISLLPRTLTTLSCAISSISEVVGPSGARSADDFFTVGSSFTVGSIAGLPQQVFQEIHSSFPPTLTRLDITVTFLDFEELRCLPSTLKVLGITFENRWGDKDSVTLNADWLPPCLSELRILGSWDDTLLVISGDLPPTLTALVCSKLDQESFTKLPRGLLDLGIPDFPPTGTMELPPRLTSLQFNAWRCEWFSLVPRSVTSFMAGDLETPTSDDSDLFAALPSTLRTLVLEDGDTPEDFVVPSSLCFSTLTSLDHLELGGNLRFPCAVFKSLPRSLIYLDLALNDLDQENAAFIPPTLKRFLFRIDIGTEPLPTWLADYWPARAIGDMPTELKGESG